MVGNYVRALHEDADGVLWIGTYDGGLYRLEKGGLTRYTTREGLHDNGVFQILEDEDGYFWMGCNRGIYRVSRRELNERAAGRLDSVRSGRSSGCGTDWRCVECNGGNQPAGMRMPRRDTLVPDAGRRRRRGYEGGPDQHPPAAGAHRDVPPSGRGDRPSATACSAEPHQNSFEIRYTALSFVKPEQIRFRYRLVGLDDDWVEAGDRRTAGVLPIPPGRYEFQVMAANSDGVWSSGERPRAIVVLAPIWRRAWFLALDGRSASRAV